MKQAHRWSQIQPTILSASGDNRTIVDRACREVHRFIDAVGFRFGKTALRLLAGNAHLLEVVEDLAGLYAPFRSQLVYSPIRHFYSLRP